MMAEPTLGADGLFTTSGTVTVYDYNAQGIYAGSPRSVFRNKGQGLPANSTQIAPPATYPAGYYPQFVNGQWAWIEDHRGEVVWNTQTKQSFTVSDTTFGPIPANTTTQAPPDVSYIWDDTEKKWVADEAAEKAQRDSRIRQEWEQLNQDLLALAVRGKTPGPQTQAYAESLYKLVLTIDRPSWLPALPASLLD